MATVKAGAGSVWGVPARGAVVNLSDADISSMLSAASGLAKGLFFASSALAIAAVGMFALLRPRIASLPWGTLANIKTHREGRGLFESPTRDFCGVCVTKEIRLNSDGHVFQIPLDYVKDYEAHTIDDGFFKKRTSTELKLGLFDGSRYTGLLLSPPHFEFLTPLGLQIVSAKSEHFIRGCTVEEGATLRKNIDEFLKREAGTAEKLLGTENFQRFFVHS